MRCQPQVVVSLGPVRLDVCRLEHGSIVARASAWLDRPTLEQAWADDMVCLDSTLAQLLKAVGAPAAAKTVIEYSSSDTAVDVITLPHSDDAPEIARKQLADASGLEVAADPSLAMLLGCSHDAGTRQAHVLCAIDRDQTTDFLRAWVMRAGLAPIAFVPIDAAAIQLAVDAALRATVGAPTVFVHLGEHRTVIVLAKDGELRLVRCVNIGTCALIDAAADAIAAGARSVDASQRRAAFETLRKAGIQSPAARGPQSGEIEWLLPYLSPALQRYVVEIRQTLRFGFGSQEAVRAVLQCLGAGTLLPGFIATLAGQLEIALSDDDTAGPSPDPQSPHTIDAGISLAAGPQRLSLTPEAHVRAQRSRRALWAMSAGALAALAVVAGDALQVWTRLQAEHATVTHLQPVLDEMNHRLAGFNQTAELRQQNIVMYRALRTGLGEQPDWKLVLAELASAAQENMKLTDFTAESGPNGTSLSLRGVVASQDASAGPSPVSASAAMSRFLTAFAGGSSVESADLGETRIAEVRGVSVEVFAADVKLRGIPFVLANSGGR